MSYLSDLDLKMGLPAPERTRLFEIATEQFVRDLDWTSEAWQELFEFDERHRMGSRLAVRVLMRRKRDGRFLMFRYPFSDGSVRWIIPGGGAEPGETPIEAAKREVWEETNCVPVVETAVGIMVHHVLHPSLADDRQTVIQYAPVLLGEIDDSDIDTAHRNTFWLTRAEFEKAPRTPISSPLIAAFDRLDSGDSAPAPMETTPIFWLPT